MQTHEVKINDLVLPHQPNHQDMIVKFPHFKVHLYSESHRKMGKATHSKSPKQLLNVYSQ